MYVVMLYIYVCSYVIYIYMYVVLLCIYVCRNNSMLVCFSHPSMNSIMELSMLLSFYYSRT